MFAEALVECGMIAGWILTLAAVIKVIGIVIGKNNVEKIFDAMDNLL